MNAIVYTSQTGFTRKYAQLLSQKVGVPAFEIKEAKKQLPAGADIFYMGWLKAGELKGLSSVVERYRIRGAAIVGMSPTGNGSLWTEARINGGVSDSGARLFYLQGGYAPEQLKGLDRFLMKMTVRSVVKQLQALGEKQTERDRDMLKLYQHGGDRVREEALDEIAAWFAEGPHDSILTLTETVDI